jgi:hypothetical protein
MTESVYNYAVIFGFKQNPVITYSQKIFWGKIDLKNGGMMDKIMLNLSRRMYAGIYQRIWGL